MAGLFSVVIPTYNSRRYASECVGSVLSQTYPNIEAVVDDNASTDGTGKLLREAFANDPRFKLFESGEDLNIPNGWNRGWLRARGEFVLLVHSDNILHKQYVELVSSMLDKYDANVVYTDCAYFEGDTPAHLFNGEGKSTNPEFDLLRGGRRTVDYVFRFESMIPISAVTLRRGCFGGKPPFNPRYAWDPDMELMVRLSRDFGVVHLHHTLVGIRTHQDQAPNWKDRSFSREYRELLYLQHREGQTERHQFLIRWAKSNQDICERLSRLRVPFWIIVRYVTKWMWAELAVFFYFMIHFARMSKRIVSTLLFSWKERGIRETPRRQ